MDVPELVYHGQTRTKKKWIMILDNADNWAMFTGSHRRAKVERNGRETRGGQEASLEETAIWRPTVLEDYKVSGQAVEPPLELMRNFQGL